MLDVGLVVVLLLPDIFVDENTTNSDTQYNYDFKATVKKIPIISTTTMAVKHGKNQQFFSPRVFIVHQVNNTVLTAQRRPEHKSCKVYNKRV